MNKKQFHKHGPIKKTLSKITDKDFFLSKSYQETMLKYVKILGKQDDITLLLDYETAPNAKAAFTNGRLLYLNTANQITNCLPDRISKIRSHKGFAAHECGHLRCSDFARRTMYVNGFSRWQVYPKPPYTKLTYEKKAWEEMKGYLAAHDVVAATVIKKTASFINNVLEDVYIESFMCREYGGSVQSAIQQNAVLIVENIPTEEKRRDQKSDGLTIMMDLLFRYARAGKTEEEKEYTKQYRSRLNACRRIIDEAVVSDDPDIRFSATNRLMLRLWKYIKQAIKAAARDLKDEISRLTEEEIRGMVQDYIERKMVWIALSDALDIPEGQSGVKTEIEGWSGDLEDMEEPQKQTGKKDELKKTLEKMREGKEPKNTEDDGEDSRQLSDLLEKMAAEKCCQDQEEDLKRALEEEAADFRLDGIHKKSRIEIHRMTRVPPYLAEEYKRIAPEIKRITKKLEESVAEVLRRQEGGVMSGLYIGKRLSRGSLYRLDDRTFEKPIRPDDGFSIVIGVLLDISLSMTNDQRIEYAKKTALVLYAFCKKMGIPIMIYGHTTHDSDCPDEVVEIHSYADFDSEDNQDHLRIMSIEAVDSNRDGVALRFVGEKLLDRPEELKILLLVSDGRPSAYMYGGEAAKEDLREAKKGLNKRGVKLFSAAIGDDRETIEEIYKDGFLNISNFSTMPIKLAGLLTQFIR